MRSERAKGIDQQPDRPVAHTFGTGDGPHTRPLRQIGRKEAHGRTGRHNIEVGASALKSPYQYPGIVAIGEVANGHGTLCKRIQYQSPVTDTF